ncbi:hypothetical protein CPT03_17520 [Pedobacter ginsengisoli]|uniref:NodB homology domain-containing protein n=1 Tax=Pedobacter ginsengisoli TaxID=363852 RepID=A0A2D1U941_9SPHI|nr:hypothetical protein CPT03_17520 [Pedobacter ginsengisoli]
MLIFSCTKKIQQKLPKEETKEKEEPAIPEGPVLPPFTGKLEIKVVFNGNPTSADALIPSLKYNKSKAILMEFDDAALTVVTAYEKLSKTFYTDGCGNNKNYSLGLAVNGKNQYNGKEMGLYTGYAATYGQRLPLILKGMDIMNHSYYHEETGNFNNGKDREKNIKDLDALILEKQGYKINTLIVPSNYTGFQTAAADFGYIGGGSQGTFDKFTQIGKYSPKAKLNDIKPFNYLAIRRAFTDDWSSGGAQWELSNDLLSGNSFDFFEIGTHGIKDEEAVRGFNDWIDNIALKSKDNLIFCSLREFLEYAYIKDHVTKTQLVSANTLVITLDYSTVLNKNISWYDLSLIVKSDKSIASVSINNPDFSLAYNKDTKLINVNRRKIKW